MPQHDEFELQCDRPDVSSHRRSITTAIACILLVCCGQHARSATWQDVSREACVQASNKQFAQSASLYSSAIEQLKRENPKDEILLDLYLNLADAYRFSGDLSKAKQSLDLCSHITQRDTWEDPLLPARYWRRKAALAEAENNLTEAVEADSNALATTCALFDSSAPFVMRQTDSFLRLLQRACDQTQSAQSFQRLIHAISRVNTEESPVRENASGILGARASKGFAKSSVGDTANMLASLFAVEDNKRVSVELFHHLLEQELKTKAGNNIQVLIQALRSMLANTNSTPSMQVTLHLMLASAYQHDGKRADAAQQVSEINRLANSIEWWTWEYAHSYRVICMSIAIPIPTDRVLVKHDCEPLIAQTLELLTLYLRVAPTASKQQLLDSLSLYTLAHARALSMLDRIDESAADLDKIANKEMMPTNDKDFLRRYMLINTRVARKQLMAGKESEARLRFSRTLQLSVNIKDVRTRRLTQDWIKLCSDQKSTDQQVNNMPTEIAKPAAVGKTTP